MSSHTVSPGMTRSIPVLALACNVPVALVAYAYGFMSTYFMNDMVRTGDHLQFIAFGMIALTISVLAMTAILNRAGNMPLGRAIGIAVIASGLLHATFVALVVATA